MFILSIGSPSGPVWTTALLTLDGTVEDLTFRTADVPASGQTAVFDAASIEDFELFNTDPDRYYLKVFAEKAADVVIANDVPVEVYEIPVGPVTIQRPTDLPKQTHEFISLAVTTQRSNGATGPTTGVSGYIKFRATRRPVPRTVTT